MDCVEGLNLTDCMCAIGEIIEAKNIVYATKISNQRICLYLSNKGLVDEITNKFNFVKIGGAKVKMRPLITKQQKLIFSNVAPPIPHYVLDDIIDSLNIKRRSPITTLKASIAKEGYGHILSSRRQTYIDPSDVDKLPELIKIGFEDVTYYVYPSTDVLKCFTCKMEGHVAKYCPSTTESSTDVNNLENNSQA